MTEPRTFEECVNVIANAGGYEQRCRASADAQLLAAAILYHAERIVNVSEPIIREAPEKETETR